MNIGVAGPQVYALSNNKPINKQQNKVAFGMKLEPNLERLDTMLTNKNVSSLNKDVIKAFVKIFSDDLSGNKMFMMCQDAVHNLGHKNQKVTDFIPDFFEQKIPLRFFDSEKGLEVSIGKDYSGAKMKDLIIENEKYRSIKNPSVDWTSVVVGDGTVLEKGLTSLAKKFAELSIRVSEAFVK